MASTNTPLHRLQRAFSEGLFLVSLILGLVMAGAMFYVRSNALPKVAMHLPEDTQSFVVFSVEAFDHDAARQESFPFEGLGDAMAVAQLPDEQLTFLEVDQHRLVKRSLEALAQEDEAIVSEQGVHCFEASYPHCYRFVREWVVLGSKERLLAIGDDVLEDRSEFGNVKGRLPMIADAFFYMDVNLLEAELAARMPSYIGSLMDVVPAVGGTVQVEEDAWYVETFMAVDKSVLGEGLYRGGWKYQHRLLSWTSGRHAFQWGGRDLASLLQREDAILAQLNPSAQHVFQASLQEWVGRYFGAMEPADLAPLLDQEYYFAWTPGESFQLLLELNGQEDLALAGDMKDRFLSHYEYASTYSLSNGEVRAELLPVEASLEAHGDRHYFRFEAEGELMMALALSEEWVLLSSSEEELLSTLDHISSGQNLRMTSDYEEILRGADELLIMDVTEWTEVPILDTVLDGLAEIASSQKFFDDGLFTRSRLTFQ